MALSISLFAGAQVKYGPVAGVNLANISGDYTENAAIKIGFHVGGVVEISVSDNFVVAPGVLFSLKGAQDKDNSKFKENLSYIEVPVNAKYKLESGLNFFAGPYVGILISAKFTNGTTDVDIKNEINSTDVGVNVGLGFDMESGLGFSAQYGIGLSNLNKDVAGSTSTPSIKNSVIGISVRYMLGDK